jgi:cell division protein FtsQ
MLGTLTKNSGVRLGRSGASRSRNPIRWEPYGAMANIIVKVALVAVAVGALLTFILRFSPQDKLQQYTHRPIKQVQIEGSFQFTSQEELQSAIGLYVQDSFLQLDLNHLKLQLEQHPWIDSVAIARMWPDKLVVRVVEQQPIARWGEKGFLNMRGDIIEVEKTTKIQSLPLLHGDDRDAQEIMGQYLRIGKLLAQQDLVLSAVKLDQTRSWTLTLQSGLIIKLGRDRLWEKLQNLVAAKE